MAGVTRAAPLVAGGGFSTLDVANPGGSGRGGWRGPALQPLPLLAFLGAVAAWLATFARVDLGVFGFLAVVAAGLALAQREILAVLLALPLVAHTLRRLRWS